MKEILRVARRAGTQARDSLVSFQGPDWSHAHLHLSLPCPTINAQTESPVHPRAPTRAHEVWVRVLHCGCGPLLPPCTLVHSSVSPYAPTCKPHSPMYKWCPAAQETWKRLCCFDSMALKVSHYLSAPYKVLVPWLRGTEKSFYLFEDRVLLCSLFRPGTCYINKADSQNSTCLCLQSLGIKGVPPLHLAGKD